MLKILLHVPFDYKKFGLPMLHVFNVSFGSFYCVYVFSLFLKSEKKEYLVLYLINLIPAILIYSRAMLFFNLASSFFLYLIFLKEIPYRRLLVGLPIIVLLFYFFGALGTKRVSSESGVAYDHNLFLDNGKATKAFRESQIPKEFFWAYFYISSPLANLQVNINTFKAKPITGVRVLEYFNNEILFESLSKRINTWFGIERESENVIKDPFNVSTVYSRGYSYLAWLGIIFMGCFLLVLPYLYLRLIENNSHQNIGIAILCCAYLFMCYDNTIRLMGLGFQLVYPIIFPLIERALPFKLRTL